MRYSVLLYLSLTLGLTLTAQGPARAADAPDKTKQYRLRLDPAAEPRPALKYVFLHEVIDQRPGNAAIAYQKALQLLQQQEEWNQDLDQCREWLDCPFANLPRADVARVVGRYHTALKQLRLASRYEQCDWQLPLREQGINALLPHLAGVRNLARLLAAKIRLDVAEGRFEAATDDLRVGLTLAGHIGSGAVLIEGLVAVAIANVMLDRIEELIQQPRAPNLYWALTDLPPDFINVWQATRWEHCFIYANLPSLRKIGHQPVTAADLRAVTAELSAMGRGAQAGPLNEQDLVVLETALAGLAVYPRARRYLEKGGLPSEELDRLSVPEVLARYLCDTYEVQRDNLFKWFGLPYAQAQAGLTRAEVEMAEAIREDPIGNFLSRMLLPALGKVHLRFTEMHRKIALLRCIEGIRLHAAAHEGALPDSLQAVVVVPLPDDPITAQPFPYRVDGNTAFLEAPPVPGGRSTKAGAIYELELRK